MPNPSPADEKFEQVLAARSAAVAGLARQVRALVRETLSDAVEVPNHGQEGIGFGANQYGHDGWGVGVIGVAKNWVTLGFMRGAHLPDPSGIVEGTGRNVRHVKVRSLQEFGERRDALVALLRAATGVAEPPAVQGALDLRTDDGQTRHSALAAERSQAARRAAEVPAVVATPRSARAMAGTLKKRAGGGAVEKLAARRAAAGVPKNPAAGKPAIKTLPKNPLLKKPLPLKSLPKKPVAKKLAPGNLDTRRGR